MKTKIESIWTILEGDSSFSTGVLLRRYASEVIPDLYVALKSQERLRAIAFRVDSKLNTSIIKADKLREIAVETLPDDSQKDKKLLLFVLLASQHSDIFAILCEDLIMAVADISEEASLLRVLAQRFEKWQHLFEKLGQTGLSENEQKGLFGELYFMKKLLQHTPNFQYAVRSWVGNVGLPQDFIHGNFWALETKTTYPSKESLSISNEYQLDETNFQALFLLHITLRNNTQKGQNLNELVQELQEILKNDITSLNLFAQKLLNVGYYSLHEPYYTEAKYEIDGMTFYQVKDNFPRLTPQDLKKGVMQVKYDISVNACTSFQINEKQLFDFLKSYE
jgi:hypothetical protein